MIISARNAGFCSIFCALSDEKDPATTRTEKNYEKLNVSEISQNFQKIHVAHIFFYVFAVSALFSYDRAYQMLDFDVLDAEKLVDTAENEAFEGPKPAK